jgi:hypothetical protein
MFHSLGFLAHVGWKKCCTAAVALDQESGAMKEASSLGRREAKNG